MRDQERWLPVVGYEGSYEVSNHGRVRSLDRICAYTLRGGRVVTRRHKGVMLRQGTMKSGHKNVALGRKTNTVLVHHLVLIAFVGPRPEGQESLHGDGNPANNFDTNLRWGTRLANVEDSLRHGTKPIGETCTWAKLSAADIPTIRERCKTEGCIKIAADYGVSRGAIQCIREGRTWKSVA